MAEVLQAHRSTFLASVLIEVVNQALTVAIGGLAAYIVASSATGSARPELLRLIGSLVGLVVLRAAAAWTSTLLSHRLAFRVLADIRMWAYWSFERTSPGTSSDRRSGDLMARVMTDAEALEVFYAHISINTAVALVLPPSILVGLGLSAGWNVPIVLVPWMLICATVPLWTYRRNLRDGDAVRSHTADLGNSILDMIAGLRELLAFGASKGQKSIVLEQGNRLAKAQRRQIVRSGLEQAVASAMVGLGVLSVIVIGAEQVAKRTMDLRNFPPTVVIAASSFAPLLAMLNGARIGGLLRASATRMFDLIEAPSHVSNAGDQILGNLVAPEIRFESVAFTYPGSTTPVLHGIDLIVHPGETLALVGPTGAGKSTLVHLLLRYFEPTNGKILANGVDITDFAPGELARMVSHVSQDVFLFHDTLLANLRIGSPGATDEQIRSCCDAAQVTPILDRLDDGLETIVGERGGRLSGGERQRVAIARALLRETPLLVLDESSSQIDVLSEREIQLALEAARKGRTTIVVAHRMSTILAADRIAVMETGRVIAVGTHKSLLDTCPLYASLIEAQQDALSLLEASSRPQSIQPEAHPIAPGPRPHNNHERRPT